MQVTIEQLARDVGALAERLIKQFPTCDVHVDGLQSVVTDDDKKLLLEFLKATNSVLTGKSKLDTNVDESVVPNQRKSSLRTVKKSELATLSSPKVLISYSYTLFNA